MSGPPQDPSWERGWRVRREVLGDEHVEKTASAWTPFNEPLREFIVRAAFGEVWARDGLDRRTRSAVTLGILAAVRADAELALHTRAAVRNGLSADEIREVLLHAAVYAGVPAALHAFSVAAATLQEIGSLPSPDA
jgi:4-carboxymuconolactone decarboxylase